MALKSTYTSEEKGAEIEEALDALDALVDRVKVLYEQYFMGIQRQPPTHLHTTLERQLRELQQQQIRNTALRYRFVTLQQKHGAYNTYWKRTLREIESGRYLRNLSKLRAKVAKTGDAIPEEILAKMPKRMRDAIERDRELALAKAAREGTLAAAADGAPRPRRDSSSMPAMVVGSVPELDEPEPATLTALARVKPPTAPPVMPATTPRPPNRPAGTLAERVDRHLLDDFFGEDDIDTALAALADEAAVKIEQRQSRTDPPPPARPSPSPSITQPFKAVPPIKIITPGFKTPATGVPVRPAMPPLRTPAHGVPVTVADGGSGPNRVLPAIPRVLGPHPSAPLSGVQPAVSPSGVHAPLSASGVREAVSPSGVHQAVTPTSADAPTPSRPEIRPPAPRPAAPRPAPSAPSSIPGMSEADTRVLYAKYVKARTLVGDATEPMTYDRMVKTLSSQAPKILRDHHSTGVEFNVVVRDNKVVLKAKPK